MRAGQDMQINLPEERVEADPSVSFGDIGAC